jgi:hypothetical protein
MVTREPFPLLPFKLCGCGIGLVHVSLRELVPKKKPKLVDHPNDLICLKTLQISCESVRILRTPPTYFRRLYTDDSIILDLNKKRY